MRSSVVIPTYNRPEKLDRTLASVRDQTTDDYEVVVVDDGSTAAGHGTVLDRHAEDPRVTVHRQENAGPAAARNRGWRHARGQFVLFTDDDCVVPPDWVESLADAFEDGVAAVGGSLVPVEELLETNRFARAHRLRDQMNYDSPDGTVRGHEGLNVGGTANVAYRRSVLEELGGFDESFPLAAGEDADLQRRVIERGYEMKFVPVTVRHNDDYEWQSFVKRAVRSGKGTYYFHRKHGTPRSRLRILAGLVGSLLYFPLVYRRGRQFDAAVLYVVERALNRWGELRAPREQPG
jgi:glycosyltransferase involved in cell wall biosynthesis